MGVPTPPVSTAPSMRATTLLRGVLGLKHTRVLRFRLTETALVLAVKPAKRSSFCSGCGCRAPRYDRRLRTWRHLDVWGVTTELEYEAWRVDCPRCGVTIEMVPWADAQSGFTRPFEDVVAYLAQHADKTTVSTLMRIAWKTVGRIIERVVARLGYGRKERFDGRRAAFYGSAVPLFRADPRSREARAPQYRGDRGPEHLARLDHTRLDRGFDLVAYFAAAADLTLSAHRLSGEVSR